MAQIAVNCSCADWETSSCAFSSGTVTGQFFRILSEDAPANKVPAHVIGLTHGGLNKEIFLLDTKLGVIYWPDCHGEIRDDPALPREPVLDHPIDYAPDNELGWRCEGACEINDFFEVLKDQFRWLHFVPLSERSVKDIWTLGLPEGLIPMVQAIFRKHGWPDLQRYRKRDCLKAMRKAMKEHYPNTRTFDIED